MLTTDVDFHAPEVEYLEEGINGLISEVTPGAYADVIYSVLSIGSAWRSCETAPRLPQKDIQSRIWPRILVTVSRRAWESRKGNNWTCAESLVFVLRDESSKVVELESLVAMTRTLVHRGPDDEGYFWDHTVGLGSRRLSIIDLSPSGRMPIFNETKTIGVVQNGEIYNFKSLRTELEGKGHDFRAKRIPRS